MSEQIFQTIACGAARGAITHPANFGLAAAHAEAARQHAAAADAHALAAEMHFEAFVPDEDFDPDAQQDAVTASADAAIQTNTAAEANELVGGVLSALRDAEREANEASRQAEDGEDSRDAHAAAAKHHAALATLHAIAAASVALGSEEAEEARAEAESATIRAADAVAAR
ncbi:hypothetical protein FV219_01690 [Methylobacterium sp. WL122]|nr:hypothetical protein FV219_01690 [Methylobacterium sp. WL122]